MKIFGLKFNIPWWYKIVVKIILSRLPINYKFWQRLGIFRHGNMDKADYALDIFNTHVSRAGINSKLTGKTLLELGPGDSVASAIISKAHGAKMVLIDSGKFAIADIKIYQALIDKLHDKKLTPPSIEGITTLSELLERCNAQYLTSGVDSMRELDDKSIDFIFSNAVLEHIRKHEFQDLLHEFERVLKSDGIASHQIDLRDHLGGGLNNLRFTSQVWESEFFASSGFYTNRIHFDKMINFFQCAKFIVSVINIQRWDTLPIPRQKLAPEFRSLPDQDLIVSSFAVVLCKRDGA